MSEMLVLSMVDSWKLTKRQHKLGELNGDDIKTSTVDRSSDDLVGR